MEPELAEQAVESMQAAPVAGADNDKEREKSVLLDRMDGAGVESPLEEMLPAQEAEAMTEEEVAPSAEEEAARVEAGRKAREALAREFPDALQPGSELAEACREEMAYLRESRSPLADDPQAEYKVARRMARLMGVRPAGLEAPAHVAKAAPLPPRRSVRPMPTGGAPVESPATALERRVAGAKSTSDMLDLMREIGTPFEALLKR